MRLAYGRTGLQVDLPEGRVDVVEPRWVAPVQDPVAACRAALRAPVAGPPLAELARGARSMTVSVCDGTRAQPRVPMLEALLLETGLDPSAVTVLVATGTHRGNTTAELAEMLGPFAGQCRVVNHDARDTSSLAYLGTAGRGVPVSLMREWVDAELRVTTGFVEPHFFAGFSGGPKMVAPGLAGLQTVLVLHDATRIGSPRATWGVCTGNPVHDDIRACAALAPPALALDVLLNRDQQVTAAYAGELFATHEVARAAARDVAMVRVPAPYGVVLTTGSGWPLDQNLYQAVKGMAAAERVVAPGGTVVLAAQAADGLPEHGPYATLLGRAGSPAELLEMVSAPGFAVQDQWQVQVQARIMSRARVQLRCDGLTDEQVRAAHLEPVADVEGAVREALDRAGPDSRVCVLPEGPQTIPYLA